jgi:hypothetical protein
MLGYCNIEEIFCEYDLKCGAQKSSELMNAEWRGFGGKTCELRSRGDAA